MGCGMTTMRASMLAMTAVAALATGPACKSRGATPTDAGSDIANTLASPDVDAAVRNEAAEALARARAEIASGSLDAARRSLHGIQQQSAGSPEAATATEELARIDQLEKAAAVEDAATIKKLKGRTTFSDTSGNKVRVNDVSAQRKWFFGSYGSGNLSIDADKGATYVVVSYDVESKQKNPSLACPLFYQRDAAGTTFHRLAKPIIEFRRWDSFGSYLGNNSDIGNDFSKSDSVQFAAGVQIEIADLGANYLYVLFTKAPHLTRHESRNQPPVSYDGDCDAPEQLSVSELTTAFEIVEIRAPRAY